MFPDASSDTSASPFLIRCSTCGAPAEFDVRNHIYKCAHCGASTDAKAPLDDLDKWRRTAREVRDASLKAHPAAVCTCQSCGASMAVNEGEMSGACPFCGATMARRSAGSDEQIPEVVIPFVLTPEDAQQRLDRWLALHRKDRCARRVRESRSKLEAVFLPYRLVKGPMTCLVKREGADRIFTCGAFINGSAINASKELPNDVLDAMEPYDWSKARAFDWGYLSGGQKARFPDVSEDELRKRTDDELSAACRPMVEKALMTVGVEVVAGMDEALDMPALLPAYVLRDAFGLTAVVNGQTGRVAVSDGSSDVRTNRWWLPPLILSFISFWLIASFNAAAHVFALQKGAFASELLHKMTLGWLSGETFSIFSRQTVNWLVLLLVPPVLFFIFRRNKAQSIAKHIASTPLCRAILTGDTGHRIQFIEGKEAVIQQDTAEVRPVFFEDEPSGAKVKSSKAQSPQTDLSHATEADGYWAAKGLFPARIRFFPPRRIIRWTIQNLITAFLPAIVCGIGALFGASVFTPSLMATMGFWLIIIAPLPLMSAARRIGIHVFDNPAIQRIHPDGSLSWVEKGEDESILLGVTQIFRPTLTFLSKAYDWACETRLGTGIGCITFLFCLLPLSLALGLLPALFCLSPMQDNIRSSGLSQASGQGTSIHLMESMFAMSQSLTQEEWDGLPELGLPELLRETAFPLTMLNDDPDKPERRERIKYRLKRDNGNRRDLDLSDFSPEYMNVLIPKSSEESFEYTGKKSSGQSKVGEPWRNYGAKLFMANAEPNFQTFLINIIDLDTKIPDDKLPLVTEFLNNFQRALPWGGFSAVGEDKNLFEFTVGIDVRGMKRIPRSWRELMTFWPIDVAETAEMRIRDLTDGKTTDVTPSEADVKALTDDFWLLSVWDGDEDEMKQGQDPGRFDRVQDLTPDEVITRFDAYLAERGFASVQKPAELSRMLTDTIKTKAGVFHPVITIDASRPKTALVRAEMKIDVSKADEEAIQRRFFKAGINGVGGGRTYFNSEARAIVVEQRLFFRLLKNPPDTLAKDAFIRVEARMMGALEKALTQDVEPTEKAPKETPKKAE